MMNPYKLKVTQGTGKIEGIPSINTDPILNPYCIKQYHSSKNTICNYCYSMIALKSFRSICRPVWGRNTAILNHGLIPLDKIERYKGTFMRLHSHGELIETIHYRNFIRIATVNDHMTFLLYTKRIDIPRRCHDLGLKKPSNLILVFSNPKINTVVTKVPLYFDKVFNVVTSEIPLFDGIFIDCIGKCAKCLKCFDASSQVQIVEKIKPYSHRCLSDPVPEVADPLPHFSPETGVWKYG